LTFDAEHPDRPGNASDGCTRVLDALAATGARATFFVQGRWAWARPAEARRIAADGHLVGLHCHSHVPYPWLTPAGVAADLAQGRSRWTNSTGPRWPRCTWPPTAGRRAPAPASRGWRPESVAWQAHRDGRGLGHHRGRGRAGPAGAGTVGPAQLDALVQADGVPLAERPALPGGERHRPGPLGRPGADQHQRAVGAGVGDGEGPAVQLEADVIAADPAGALLVEVLGER